MQTMKCKYCGTTQEVSREGWLVDSVKRDYFGNPIPNRREVKYFEWIHVVGHWFGKRMCPGSGASPAK